ncbi:MAG: tRNA (guanosine(37)-N1)-methyltransferase TrmD [Ruminococcaceae bacterium]|nr:tRNA (guanosine(37)-N1)-methyltransferase TrmD [Oscillospiraceae bacterium]
MRIDILTLFPQMCDAVMSESIIGRAREKGKVEINFHQIRDFAINKHGQIDDTPYGGGAGMLMLAQPIYDCFEKVCNETGTRPHFIYMSPCGKTLTQERIKELSEYSNIAILCGRYEGVDQRVLDELVDEEISIGDYVVTGGELPAMILADGISRMLPGVLSAPEGFMGESHYSSLLEHPQYTKPPVWHGVEVPEVLTTGHHANIRKWQRERSIERTLERRPDLLENAQLDKKEKEFLEQLKAKD